jgi:PPOX class probable F420-dependent enzyme
MSEPRASRPHMPGYGVVETGDGLLSWSWAHERLTASRNYWLATTWPDGRPHVMPVWGVWDGSLLWFSTGLRSRKARNLAVDPRCVVATEDAASPVVVEGVAELTRDPREIADFVALVNAKYDTDYGVDFQDPAVNATVRVVPRWAFGVADGDFTGSPTRWSFD